MSLLSLVIMVAILGFILTLVPLLRASVGRDYVRVDRRKAVFKKAPSFETDKELTLDDEAAEDDVERIRQASDYGDDEGLRR